MTRTGLAVVASVLLLALASPALQAGQLINRARNGLAIDGYDPVAYFVEGKPLKGNPAISVEIDGTRYYFASTATREMFVKNPQQYAPQYGGFCAYAVSRGYTADIDPQAWAVVDGKLYLNYSKRAQRLWQEDVPGNIRKGDANWPRLRDDGK